MNQTVQRRLVVLLVSLDAVGVALALATAYWLRIASGLLPERAFEEFAVYLRVSALIVPIWLAIFAFHHLYDLHLALSGIEEYIQLAKACTYGIVSVIMLSYWVRIATLSRGWLALAWLFGVLYVGGSRFILRRAIYRLRRQGKLRTRAIIVGANEQGKAIARQFQAAHSAGMDVVGFIDDFLPAGALVSLEEGNEPGGQAAKLRVLGGPDRLLDLARDYQVSQVVVVSNAVAWETFQEIMQATSLNSRSLPFEIKLSPGFYEILTTGVQVTHEAFVPLLLVNRHRITGVEALLKAALDYGLALFLGLVALPVSALIGLALRLDNWRSGRPDESILERHVVFACGGGTFTTWKFHTGLDRPARPPSGRLLRQGLVMSALGQGSAVLGQQVLTTAEAGWLRRLIYATALDKLPQIYNVLRGEMSWVGPRTVDVGQTDSHSSWLPNLLTVKPGITGPWAVGEKRTLDDEMRLTMYYIRNWTIWLDLQILFQTALRVLRRERVKARMPEQ